MSMELTSRPPDQDDWDRHWHELADAAGANPAQRYRTKLILSLLGLRDGSTDRVLDIGSGQGDLARDLRARYARIQLLGLELSSAGIEISRRKVPSATFIQRDLLRPAELPERHYGWATHAVCSEVLEHVDEPVVLLKNALPYLAPGCRLVITVPGGPMSAYDRHIGHRRHFSRSALRQLLLSAGLIVEHVTGAGFPFFDLYRILVVLRGEKLLEDVRVSSTRSSAASRVAMAIFDRLFDLNLRASALGWQIVAQARLP